MFDRDNGPSSDARDGEGTSRSLQPQTRRKQALVLGLDARDDSEFSDADFATHLSDAAAAADAALFAETLTGIRGAQEDVKLLLRRLESSLAERDHKYAQRDAALAQRLVSAAELAQAARTGAQSGVGAALEACGQHITRAAMIVEAVNTRLDGETKRREGERDLWVQATMYAAVSAFIAVLISLGGGYWMGKSTGQAHGYAKARDEVAASSWANTDDGRFAQRLYANGELAQMQSCTGAGWQVAIINGKRACLGGPASAGWYMR